MVAFNEISALEKKHLRERLSSSNFTKERIAGFLEKHELPKSGVKADLVDRLFQKIELNSIPYGSFMDWIDNVELWNKQHVYLFDGPEGELWEQWQDIEWAEQHLESVGLARLFNKKNPLALPEKLNISSIMHNGSRLQILAVQKHRYELKIGDREPDENDADVYYQKYQTATERVLVNFEWEFASNEAMIQISQLSSEEDYEEIRDSFIGMINNWLNIQDKFTIINLANSIARLRHEEQSGSKKVSSHEMRIATPSNRQINIRSSAADQSTLGEKKIDDAFDYACSSGIGKFGNFYWLQHESIPELSRKVHVKINAIQHRINFTATNSEKVIRHVLKTLRTVSQ
jgi:hypothetical protein